MIRILMLMENHRMSDKLGQMLLRVNIGCLLGAFLGFVAWLLTKNLIMDIAVTGLCAISIATLLLDDLDDES